MKIILSPIACFSQDTPPIVNGELLTYRGVDYDLTQLQEGATVEAELPFIGNISRVNGQVQLKLQYCYHMEKAEDHQPHNWDDYTFVVSNGKCPCPIKFKPVQEVENDN